MRSLSSRDSAALSADLGWSTRARVSLLVLGAPATHLPFDGHTFALWRLDEARSWDKAMDVGDRFHMAPTGSPGVATAPGDLVRARTTGTGKYFLAPTLTADQQRALREELTLEALVYLDPSWSAAGDVVSAGGSGETVESNSLFQLEIDSSRRVRFVGEVWGGVNVSTAAPTDPAATLPTGAWKHVAARRRWGSADTFVIDLFVDGVLVYSEATWQAVGPMAAASDGSARLAIGCWHEVTNLFNGSISNVCVSTVARSDADILQRARQLLGVERWVDLTDLDGRDYLVGLEVNEDVDQPVAQATVRVRRELDAVSLAPLRTDARPVSGVTLVEQGRRFRIESATVPVGGQATSADWRELFRGDIDEVESGDTASDVITFTGRDLGGELQDRWVEAEKEYGSSSGVPVQTVMQAILDDALGAGAVTLQVDTSNGAVPWGAVKTYLQQREPVLDALRGLALQMGWDVRYRWRDVLGAFALTLSCPDRNASSPVFTFGAKQVRDFRALTQSREDVRNVIEVVYADSADKDSSGVPKRKTVTVQDATSIAKYKRRWMQLALDAADAIDTNAEATTLANAALSDLKDPLASAETEVPLFWPVQLGDYLGLKANGLHFNADQSLAVVGFTHAWDGTTASTTMRLRGKPAVASGAWLEMEVRPGMGEPAHSVGPQPPTGLAVSAYDGGAVVTWQPAALGEPAVSYDVYVAEGTSVSATAGNFRGNVSGTRLEVTGLKRGAAHTALVVPRDAAGTAAASGATSASFTPSYVQPAHLSESVQYAYLPLNGDFEAQTDPAGLPDGWYMDQGAWGTDVALVASSSSGPSGRMPKGGARMVEFKNTAVSARVQTPMYAARPGDVVLVRGWAALPTAPMPANADPEVAVSAWVNTFDAAGTYLSTISLGDVVMRYGSYWQNLQMPPCVVPSNAAYLRVIVGKKYARTPTNNTAYYAWLDSVRVYVVQGSDDLDWIEVGTQSRPPLPRIDYYSGIGPRNDAGFYNTRVRVNSQGEVEIHGLSQIDAGVSFYPTLTTMFVLPAGYRPKKSLIFAGTAIGGGSFDVEVLSTGEVRMGQTVVGGGTIISFSGIRFQAEQ